MVRKIAALTLLVVIVGGVLVLRPRARNNPASQFSTPTKRDSATSDHDTRTQFGGDRKVAQALVSLRDSWRLDDVRAHASALLAACQESPGEVTLLLDAFRNGHEPRLTRSISFAVVLALSPQEGKAFELAALQSGDRDCATIGLLFLGVRFPASDGDVPTGERFARVLQHPLFVEQVWLPALVPESDEMRAEIQHALKHGVGWKDPRAPLRDLTGLAGIDAEMQCALLPFLRLAQDDRLVEAFAAYAVIDTELPSVRAWLSANYTEAWAGIGLRRTAIRTWTTLPYPERRSRLADLLASPGTRVEERDWAIRLLASPAVWDAPDAPCELLAPWLDGRAAGGSSDLSVNVAATLLAFDTEASVALVSSTYRSLGNQRWTALSCLKQSSSAAREKALILEEAMTDTLVASRLRAAQLIPSILKPFVGRALLKRARQTESVPEVSAAIDEALGKLGEE